MPVFGIEYKERKSDQRYGITPSLIARYTIGSQLGIKMRSKLLNDWLILAASVTNNSSTIEMFHFYSEIDKNNGKTLNGRAAVSIPVGRLYHNDDRLEIGFSGEWGAQDRATDNAGKMWFAGIDLQYLGVNYAVRGQILEGTVARAPGRGRRRLGPRPQPVWLPRARLAAARALRHLSSASRSATRSSRSAASASTSPRNGAFTAGVHVVVNPHIVVKAEYLHNDEYGGINEFDNDVATSSLVLAF